MIRTISISPQQLRFKKAAKTSRGVYTSREIYLIKVEDHHGRYGIGEAAPLFDLSPEYHEEYLSEIRERCKLLIGREREEVREVLEDQPALCFAVESALSMCQAPSRQLYDTPFTRGEKTITINGLIWMGSHEEMLRELKEKIEKGFRCIKLKVGAIDLEQEIDLMRRIRQHFAPEELELRIDANGAFAPEKALSILNRLSKYHIHSIEQPIKPGAYKQMGALIKNSPIPIAFDEELIGIYKREDKVKLLDLLQPHYIILKPTLHGGLSGAEEWIEIATERQIQWWATSALESNIGLSAIAQWVSQYEPLIPQGLGTGALYVENYPSPLQLRGAELSFDPLAARTIAEQLLQI